ncbi:hypothetical protein [Sulfurisphaera tokodaii]|uniref:Uncharacterized protein n=2 Tax=Sulfurisphaera tokodaii TaxID=111955 RepID=Q96XH7_SULTO|nr:hypothetical protein [Sulfurisphaera tokodaii]BAB67650.1 hypothetical protein STK_25380 [Sulfurisphaera tokodaii str. 7]HII75333.1 hypothetical protein [Sulfurisphaera tokodaii]
MKLLYISLFLIVLGILLVPITYFVSNEVIYKSSFNRTLSDLGAYTINIPKYQGELVVRGYTNSTVTIEVLKYLELIKSEEVNGNFSFSLTDNNANAIFLHNGYNPAHVYLFIKIINSGFQGIGYTIASLLIIIGLILLGYHRVLSK